MDDLFVFGFLNSESTWTKTLLAVANPGTSCEFRKCTSNSFSCNFLDLAINQSPRGIISSGMFDKHIQLENAGIDMVCMHHAHSNISMTSKLGIIKIQF